MEKPREVYGCDIGNGFGFISILDENGKDPVVMLPAMADLNVKEGMPAAAFITPPSGDPITVFGLNGDRAEKKIKRKPELGVRAVKTILQNGDLTLRGIDRPISPYDIYGAIVHDLIVLANSERVNKPIYSLVFAYPALLDSSPDSLNILNRMQQSIEKIEVDGTRLKVLGRIPEPAAVAIDYLYYMQHVAPESIRLKDEEFTVLVYDLGHGTFDAAVVTARSRDTAYDIWAKDGLPDVGGKDFDRLLMQEMQEMLLEEYSYQPKNNLDRELLRQEAVAAKHDLSNAESTTIQHQNPEDGSFMELEVTRTRFEALASQLLLETVEKTQALLRTEQAKGRKINAIVLSGGASRMPMVKKALETYIQPQLPVILYRPSEAVSFGAARYAQGIREEPQPQPDGSSTGEQPSRERPVQKHPNTVARQFANYSYGILQESSNPGQLEGEIAFLIKSGQPLPATSQPHTCVSGTERLTLRVTRAKDSGDIRDTASPQDCVGQYWWFTFNVPSGSQCAITLSVGEDYNIAATCRLEDGSEQSRSTQLTHLAN